MRIVLISDTHEQHDQVTVPPCDVLIHAGDLTYRGTIPAVQEALGWLDKQPAEHVICIAGNHDFLFEERPGIAKDLLLHTRVEYLENSGVTIQGVKFWGSPLTPKFFDWAFMYDRATGKEVWEQIPNDIDVLITHGPAYGIGDQAAPHKGSEHLGCFDLRQALDRVQPKLFVFGHIHGGNSNMGSVHELGVQGYCYNASVVNEAYKVVNKPYEIDLGN